MRLTITQKLSIGFLGISLLLVLVGLFGFSAAREIVKSFEGGEQHFRPIVTGTTEIVGSVKEAESHLILFLTIHDPEDKEEALQWQRSLRQLLLILNERVGLSEGRAILEKVKSSAEEFLSISASLLETYDRDMGSKGVFDPRQYREMIRGLNNAASEVRGQGIRLAEFETQFLNKQEVITAATELSSYAKRAEGHLLLFLTLDDESDREKFFERHGTLTERIATLDEWVRSPEGRMLLVAVKARAEELLSLGRSLIEVHAEDVRVQGRFDAVKHRDLLKRFENTASRLRESGFELAQLKVSLEQELKDRALLHAKYLQRTILVAIAFALVLSLVLGYASARTIARPLKQLRGALDAVGRGHFDTTIKATSKDEVGDLADSFNSMVEELDRSRSELLTAKDYLDNIIKSMSDGLIVVSPDGIIQTANNAACTMLGYCKESLVGRTLEELFAEMLFAGDSGFHDVITRGSVRNQEKTCVTRDGRKVEVLFSSSVMRGRDGEHQGIVCIVQDITQRKRAREALRRSEEQFRLVFENAPIGMAHAALDGRFLRVNQAFCDALGYGTAELLNMKFAGISHPDDLGANIEMNERLLKGESSHHRMEKRYIRKDGSTLHAILNVSLVRDSKGRPLNFIGQIVDISDRKKAEEALERSYQQNKLLLEAVGEGLYGVDRKGRVTFVNHAALEMIGFKAEELIGQSIHHMIHGLKQDGTPYPVAECPIYWALKEGKRCHVSDEVFWRKDGTSFPVEYVSTPIIERDEIVGSVVVFIDITERKSMEEELIRARKLESTGILASGLAHDFNNLLTGVLNCLSLAKMSVNASDPILETLTVAEEASRQAKRLTHELFSLAKIGGPVKNIADIGGLVRDAARFSASGYKVACEFSIADDLWPVEVDEGQISRVIHNLVINAAEAMPEGGVITMRAENVLVTPKKGLALKEGKYVRISVEDQGGGIPEQHIEKIFDPYFTTKQRDGRKGIGLGLAICYSIVRNHNGLITVESRPGAGTSFRIYLRASAEEICRRIEENLPVEEQK